MTNRILRSIQRFVVRLCRAPFEHLPDEYGDLTPTDLRAFTGDAADKQAGWWVKTEEADGQAAHSQPARRDESLERQ